MAAQRRGAELVVFPELFVFDRLEPCAELVEERRQLENMADTFTNVFFERIQNLSKKLGLGIVAGSIPRRHSPGVIRNTTLVAMPGGAAPVYRDKVFPTACERNDWQWQGGAGVESFETPWGRMAVMICYDSEFAALSQQLVPQKPEWIVVPSWTSSVHGFHRVRWSCQARAVEHHAFVVHTGTVGAGVATPNGEGHYAQASVITPCEEGWEHLLVEGRVNESQIVTATLDLDKLRKSRLSASAYPARDTQLYARKS